MDFACSAFYNRSFDKMVLDCARHLDDRTDALDVDLRMRIRLGSKMRKYARSAEKERQSIFCEIFAES